MPTINEAVLANPEKPARYESIDLLRGSVMIIMALDHTRDYFHNGAFRFNPEDLTQTDAVLFFTRWITHFCAPIFLFLAGVSARLYGSKKSKKELSFFLLTRGLWLVFIELFILSFFRTFNPGYEFTNLQVIWVIGLSMIALSGLIYAPKIIIFIFGLLLVGAHNLLDGIHVNGNNVMAFAWSVLHEPKTFTIGHFTINVLYPLIPWIGIMAIGYCAGGLYSRNFDRINRKRILIVCGAAAITLFIILRFLNNYGDASKWSVQSTSLFSMLSFLNVTKYPPSLLYALLTLGPALIVLGLTEGPLNAVGARISVFGRSAMFYYLAHFLFIHLLAMLGAVVLGYQWSDMVLSTRVQAAPQLRGYGYDLSVVYVIWIWLIFILYPLCKWYDAYKRKELVNRPWLSYV